MLPPGGSPFRVSSGPCVVVGACVTSSRYARCVEPWCVGPSCVGPPCDHTNGRAPATGAGAGGRPPLADDSYDSYDESSPDDGVPTYDGVLTSYNSFDSYDGPVVMDDWIPEVIPEAAMEAMDDAVMYSTGQPGAATRPATADSLRQRPLPPPDYHGVMFRHAHLHLEGCELEGGG